MPAPTAEAAVESATAERNPESTPTPRADRPPIAGSRTIGRGAAPPPKPTGNLWQLGRHRLICADNSHWLTYVRLTVGSIPDLAHIDPPYGHNIGRRGKRLNQLGYPQIAGDRSPFDPTPWLTVFQLLDRGDLFPDTAAMNCTCPNQIFWGADHYSTRLPISRGWLVWDKQGGKTTSYGDAELAWLSREMPNRVLTHIWDGARRASERGQKRIHPNQKPVAVVEWALSFFPEAKTVLDPFSGSGSAILACENTGRTCFAIELDPYYVERAVTRWEAETGIPALLLEEK